MKKRIIPLICLLSLTVLVASCGKIRMYRPDIQQGNIITQPMVDQLKAGMTKNEVADILGEPVLADSFDYNAWHYVNTFEANGKTTITQRLNVFFKDYRLSSVSGDFAKIASA